MPTMPLRTATVLLLGLALTANTASAQGRRDRSEGGRDQGRQAEPRGGGRTGPRDNAGPSAERRTERQPDVNRRPQADRPQRGDNQPRAQVQPRRDAQPRWDNRSRPDDRSRWDDRRDDGRRAVPRVQPYRGRDDRWRGSIPQYRYYGGGYRQAPRRVYVVPYGYRPYGYRPGWNFNLYFGRPYGRYIYGSGAGYGYYALAPGFAYGSLRIVDAPRYAQVFVDGYYAGEVDDYDGIFQRLNLEPGPHHIEISVDDYSQPLAFDVQIIPGQTLTYHARW